MRSFHLLFILLSLLVSQTAYSASSDVMPDSFFTVVLPYDRPEMNDGKALTSSTNAVHANLLNKQMQEGMKILLLRLTGRKQLLESKIGQNYIKQAKNWLGSYYIKPRMEDGVAIGKNIELNFDALRLKNAFNKQHIKLWAANQRPSTLVMGTYVQQGRLEKLNQEILDYRIDVDFREYPKLLGLPVFIPDERGKWVFPVEPSLDRTKIQEILLSQNQQNLLSFKLLAKSNGVYELSWYLFSLNGSTLVKSTEESRDRQKLLNNMFEAVMYQYLKKSAVQSTRKNHFYLNVNQVAFADQINDMEKELKSQQPMIRKVNLVTLSAGKAQFDIEYQGSYDHVLNWLKNWPKVTFVGALPNKQEIDVNVHYQRFMPQLKYKAKPADHSNAVEVQ